MQFRNVRSIVLATFCMFMYVYICRMLNYLTDKQARDVKGADTIWNQIKLQGRNCRSCELWRKEANDKTGTETHLRREVCSWKDMLLKFFKITTKNWRRTWRRYHMEFFRVKNSWHVVYISKSSRYMRFHICIQYDASIKPTWRLLAEIFNAFWRINF